MAKKIEVEEGVIVTPLYDKCPKCGLDLNKFYHDSDKSDKGDPKRILQKHLGSEREKTLWSINRMKSLTLNDDKKQLRCKPSLASQLGFQYEYMINNEWTPVTHKEVRTLWLSFYKPKMVIV